MLLISINKQLEYNKISFKNWFQTNKEFSIYSILF